MLRIFFSPRTWLISQSQKSGVVKRRGVSMGGLSNRLLSLRHACIGTIVMFRRGASRWCVHPRPTTQRKIRRGGNGSPLSDLRSQACALLDAKTGQQTARAHTAEKASNLQDSFLTMPTRLSLVRFASTLRRCRPPVWLAQAGSRWLSALNLWPACCRPRGGRGLSTHTYLLARCVVARFTRLARRAARRGEWYLPPGRPAACAPGGDRLLARL